MHWLNREGVALAYRETPGRHPPVLLVHGCCCDNTYLAPQFEHFEQQGHRVVAVDLRGHGRSDKPPGAYTMQVFADDLAWICEKMELQKPIVIGHSMGGIVAFDLAARYPELASAIVMIDAAVVLPEPARAAIDPFIEALRAQTYRDTMRAFVSDRLFLSTDDPGRKAMILEQMLTAPQHVMIAAFEGLRDYDPSEGEGGIAVPGLYIAADETPRADMIRFHKLAPQILFGQTVGSGHFCQLEVPEQVNAMIDRFLKVAL